MQSIQAAQMANLHTRKLLASRVMRLEVPNQPESWTSLAHMLGSIRENVSRQAVMHTNAFNALTNMARSSRSHCIQTARWLLCQVLLPLHCVTMRLSQICNFDSSIFQYGQLAWLQLIDLGTQYFPCHCNTNIMLDPDT